MPSAKVGDDDATTGAFGKAASPELFEFSMGKGSCMVDPKYPFTSWALANIFMSTPWPTVDQQILQGGHRFYVIPQRGDSFPAVALERTDLVAIEEDYSLIARFLSSITWFSEGRIAVFSFGGCSRRPNPLVGFSRNSQNFMPYFKGRFAVSELPLLNGDQNLSLAFWREGCNLEFTSPHYAVLSFFKILERAFPEGKERGLFVSRGLTTIPSAAPYYKAGAMQEIAAIQAEGCEIGEYLRSSCRCAVAHGGNRHPASNPDNANEEGRLRRALPILKMLAYICMTDEMAIPEPRKFRLA